MPGPAGHVMTNPFQAVLLEGTPTMQNASHRDATALPDIGGGKARARNETQFNRKSFAIDNPAEFDDPSFVSRHLPGQNNRQTYRLRDRNVARSGKRQLLSNFRYEWAGDLQLSHVTERFATDIGILNPGIDLHCFGRLHSGRMQLTEADGGHSVDLRPGQGAIHRGAPGTQASTADGTVRTNFWITSARLDTALAACLKEPPRERLVFSPIVDWTTGAGARLGRLIEHVEAEFTYGPGGLADNPVALSAFADLFVHSALRALPHNQTERLSRHRDGPAPRQVRRAEEFFHAHADEPILMEDVAAAAGCSVRALQLAFRQFRDISPHGALMNARLERARDALLRDEGPIKQIAKRFGFSHPGRFAAAYARRFGEAPSRSLR